MATLSERVLVERSRQRDEAAFNGMVRLRDLAECAPTHRHAGVEALIDRRHDADPSRPRARRAQDRRDQELVEVAVDEVEVGEAVAEAVRGSARLVRLHRRAQELRAPGAWAATSTASTTADIPVRPDVEEAVRLAAESVGRSAAGGKGERVVTAEAVCMSEPGWTPPVSFR